jgi:predicted PP-loop superfamily ATPase
MSEQTLISRRQFTARSIAAGALTATGAHSISPERRAIDVGTPAGLALFKGTVA